MFLDVFIDRAALALEPHGLAFTPDGSSLLVSSDLVQRIRKYDAVSGAFQGFFGPDDGLYSGQIAFGPDGNLYVPDPTRDNVRRYDGASGASLGIFASGGGMTGPFGLAFGPDGNLYVSSGGDDRIYVYDGGNGSFLRSFAATGLDLRSLTYLAFASPIPEPKTYLLWLAATALIGLRLGRFARRKSG
jgi:DNA-binding beta-propeller fold protein YncE